MSTLPTFAQVRAFVKVPATHIADADLQRSYDSAVEVVGRTCRVPLTTEGAPDLASSAWPSSLVEAILRRVQRSIAARSLPLGVLDNAGEYGPARIPTYDVMIEELEGPFRKVVFG